MRAPKSKVTSAAFFWLQQVTKAGVDSRGGQLYSIYQREGDKDILQKSTWDERHCSLSL